MSKQPKHNAENCRQLAKSIVEGMRLEDMIASLSDRKSEEYKQNEYRFQEAWDSCMGDEEPTGGVEDD